MTGRLEALASQLRDVRDEIGFRMEKSLGELNPVPVVSVTLYAHAHPLIKPEVKNRIREVKTFLPVAQVIAQTQGCSAEWGIQKRGHETHLGVEWKVDDAQIRITPGLKMRSSEFTEALLGMWKLFPSPLVDDQQAISPLNKSISDKFVSLMRNGLQDAVALRDRSIIFLKPESYPSHPQLS